MLTRVLISAFLANFTLSCVSQGSQATAENSPKAEAAADQMQWILQVLGEKKGVVTSEEVKAHFHDMFLSQIPVDQTIETLSGFGKMLESFSVQSIQETQPDQAIVKIAHIQARNGTRWKILVAEDKGTGKINGLYITRDIVEIPPTADAMKQALQETAPQSSLFIAEIAKGQCTAVVEKDSANLLAIGSAFKLYVLQAAMNEVKAGSLTWKQPIAIKEEWKSLESGTMQNEPAGKTFSLQDMAAQMIAVSDNTATDHVMLTVGKKKVEALMPAKNTPMVTTRELFMLKELAFKNELDPYLKLSPVQKAAFLEQLAKKPGPDKKNFENWQQPTQIADLEWFASGRQICDSFAKLMKGPEALAILQKNPGLPIRPEVFPYAGFKGGSEPGVLSLNWLLKRKDNRWFVVSMTANDPDRAIPEEKLLGVATGALKFLEN